MSNDLISRAAVLTVLENVFSEYKMSFGASYGGFAEAVPKAIQDIPTAYDMDSVVEQLEKRLKFYEERIEEMSRTDRDVEDWGSIKSYKDSLEIVQSGITATNENVVQATHECIREFVVEKYDDNGFPTGKDMIVKEGSKWEVNKKSNITGGEIHLDNVEGTEWVEISEEILNDHFKETVATNDENGGRERWKN